ncbi:DUF6538 domain-containing protein, partial [Rhodopseudomonas sp. B29]|uniref:DUF6538 domain-containing protein n=1 Tax=Rhodopseudomonas sp. B29 TaxID=95607 RepID=UPI0035E3DEFC
MVQAASAGQPCRVYGGKREIKFSLGTSDPKLAEVLFRERNAEIERFGTSISMATNIQ